MSFPLLFSLYLELMELLTHPRLKFFGTFLLALPLVSYSQWVQLAGPDVGTISSISTINGALFCTGNSASFYRSDASGTVWSNASTELTMKQVIQVEGEGPYALAATELDGIWFSSDSASTWAQATGLPPGSAVEQILLMDSVAFASTQAGFYQSVDHGSSWSLRSPVQVGHFTAIGDRLVGGFGQDGIKISDDDGSTWTYSNDGLPFNYIMGQIRYAAPSSFCVRDSTLFLTCDRGLVRSDNSGTSWVPVGFDWHQINGMVAFQDTLIITDGSELQFSFDDGQTWAASTVDTDHTRTLCTAMNNGRLFVGTDNGIYYSTDLGASWQRCSGPINGSFIDIEADPDKIVIAGAQGVFHSADHGTTWNASSGLSPGFTVTDLVEHDVYWLANSNVMYRSADDASSWEQVYFYPLEGLFSMGPYLFGGYINGVRRSADDGQTWIDVNNGFPFNNMAIVCFGSEAGVLYAGSLNFGVYHSMDMGLTWMPALSGIMNEEVRSITTLNGSIFAATNGNGIFRSDDQGLNWYEVNAGLPPAVALDMVSVDGLLVATFNGYGVYISEDLGAYWHPVNEGLFDRDVWSITTQGDSVFASTIGSGVFAAPISYLLSSVGITEQQTRPDLYLNIQPNPCMGETDLTFALDMRSIVRVQILDMLGRELMSTGPMTFPAGEHTWHVQVPATGPVLVRLFVDENAYTKQVINLGR